MAVCFFSDEIKYNFAHKRKIKRWIKETINRENAEQGNINIIFTSDKNILKINKKHLSHNYYTDVITFNYCENDFVHGDIYISIETVENNSVQFNVTFIEELLRVIIHGILHLLGYDDRNDDEKQKIKEKENFYLDRLKNLS